MFFISISAIETKLFAIIAIVVALTFIPNNNEKQNKPIEPIEAIEQQNDLLFVIVGSFIIIAVFYIWPKFSFLGILLWSLIYVVYSSSEKLLLGNKIPNASI